MNIIEEMRILFKIKKRYEKLKLSSGCYGEMNEKFSGAKKDVWEKVDKIIFCIFRSDLEPFQKWKN